jgi:phosphocarrier protein HPr
MVSETVIIQNSKGLHLRPVTILCETACRYRSKCVLRFDGKEADTKSVLSLLAAGLHFGDTVRLVCDGPDEKEAMDGILAVFRNGFQAPGE